MRCSTPEIRWGELIGDKADLIPINVGRHKDTFTPTRLNLHAINIKETGRSSDFRDINTPRGRTCFGVEQPDPLPAPGSSELCFGEGDSARGANTQAIGDTSNTEHLH